MRVRDYLAMGASLLGMLALVGAMALPWLAVTSAAPGATGETTTALYAWQTPANLLLPLLFLPALCLIVSVWRARKRGEPPTSDARAIAILGVVAVVAYAFLLYVAAAVALAAASFRAVSPTPDSVTIGAGAIVALAGALVALAGVLAVRRVARTPQPAEPAEPAQSGG